MILTLTPNPALDMTYEIDTLRVGEPHVVASVRTRAGGKGVNTAAILTALGIECVAVCPIGREDASIFIGDLDERGIRSEVIAVSGRVRRTVAAVESDRTATVFNEPGTTWPTEPVLTGLTRLVNGDTALAVCGSLPPAVEPAVLEAVRLARSRSARVVLDLRGSVLRKALALDPDLVKPNRAEACATLGLDDAAPPPARELAARLVDAGARAAVVSDGHRGVSLATQDGVRLRARLREPLQGNATGAGDALTAALTHHVSRVPHDWHGALRDGVAWSAAAVLQPVAGQVDPHDVTRLTPRVVVEDDAPPHGG